ncbi:MAG TPA: hypothetical protein VJ970_04405, partial [Flavobacteriaceae bacterium]|nr:hypothetical protein [Flavobacteriaceae bacterium]
MRFLKFTLILLVSVLCTNCASSYKTIELERVNFMPAYQHNNIDFQYKYDLLDKKYRKKELKKGVKLVALK